MSTPKQAPTTFQALSAGLPAAGVQSTKRNQTRKAYDTDGYGYQWVADRLNEVLGVAGWSVTELRSEVTVGQYGTGKDKFTCCALIRIRVFVGAAGPGVGIGEREMWGGHESITEADARKGAFTNGFKKCAALLGVGGDAYRGMLDPDNTPHPEGPETPTTQPKQNVKQSVKRDVKKEAEEIRKEIADLAAEMGPGLYRALVPQEPSNLKEAKAALDLLREAQSEREIDQKAADEVSS